MTSSFVAFPLIACCEDYFAGVTLSNAIGLYIWVVCECQMDESPV